MDGLTLLRDLRIALQEPSGGTWLDTRYSYDCLYAAAITTAERTNILTTITSITTVASQASYTLPGDFLKLYLMDDQNRRFIKYSNGTSIYFIYESSYDSIYLGNNTTSYTFTVTSANATIGAIYSNNGQQFTVLSTIVGQTTLTTTGSNNPESSGTLTKVSGTGDATITFSALTLASSVLIPSSFIIRDAGAITQITGSVSSAGTLSNGTTALNKTGETFITKGVTAGDLVHDTTDASSGVVVTVDSEIKLTCCLFDGTNNYFSYSAGPATDVYIINPQGRFQITFDPPPSTAGHTITVPYVQRPSPVYSSYYRYRFPFDWRDLLVSYAAWKYKYRDREPDFGDRLYKFWDARVRQVGHSSNEVQRRTRFNVNLNKSSGSNNTWR